MICSKCNTFNDDSSNFCRNCGAVLSVAPQTVPTPGSANHPYPPITNPPGTPINPENKQKKTILTVVIVLLIMVIIGVAALLIYLLAEKFLADGISVPTFAVTEAVSTTSEYITDTAADTTAETIADTTLYSSYEETQPYLPAELKPYRSGLVQEKAYYRVVMEGSQDLINARTTPEYLKDKSNVCDKIIHGTEIYVEYIYNDIWVVYQLNGRYVFSSMYASADPGARQMIIKIY